MKRRLRRWVAHALQATGAVALLRPWVNRYRLRVDARGRLGFPPIARRAGRILQILIYHRVNDERDPYFPAVPIDSFRAQMEYLAGTHAVLPLSDALARRVRSELPENAVALTFDDGYRDNLDHAFPILARLGLPAALFVSTSSIGTGRPLWHDRVFAAFRTTGESVLRDIAPDVAPHPLRTVEERLRVQRAVLAHLRKLGEADRDRAIDRLVEALRVAEPPHRRDLMLGWEELRTLHREGIEIGSHTASHPILSRISDERAREELLSSRLEIERRLGVSVLGLAYPNGAPADFTRRTKELLRECGYRWALTTIPGVNEADTDPFELRRATPWDEEVGAFALRLNYQKIRF